MSGGGNKKKSAQSQGWEEAGAEFYQESYPLDAEIEVLRHDPRRLATLLPSKQTRAAIATIKIRSGAAPDGRTAPRGKRTGTRGRGEEATAPRRRASQVGDVQVAMMPDLSEMQSNEKTAWEEVMQLKAMPVPMAQKREMKAKILNEPNLRLQGYEQFRWRRRKMWDRLAGRLGELLGRFVLWRGSMKHIEGNFGTGVVALFLFLRWLLLLNLATSLLLVAFVALPTALLEKEEGICNGNETTCCAEQYFNYSSTGGVGDAILEALQGAGVVERTVVFYGYYRDRTFGYYDAPLAYLFAALACLLLALAAIVRSAAGGFRQRLVEGEGQFYRYCDLVLGGWDFCIDNARAAEAKHRALHGEIRAQLETERAEEERRGRTRRERYRTYAARAAVNACVAAMLAGAGFAIYLVFSRSNEALKEFETGEKSALHLLYEFLPSMTIVGLNVAVPFLFKYLIKFERYSPNVELRLSLVRTVFLRLASLIVLYVSLLAKVSCGDDGTMAERSCVACPDSPVCWETFVGQQVLKLLLTDFGAHVLLTFAVNLPRGLLARHVSGRVCALLCAQTFDLPKHALDVVYIQTLTWFGTFYSPLLPILTTVILFLLFYVKKFACLVNSRQSATIYRASRSNSMFMLVLLVSYACAVLPVAYSIAELAPSRSCGPFRRAETVWSYAAAIFSAAPSWLRSAVFFVGTAGFAVPCFVVLLFLLYYYAAIGSANRHMVAVLKNQLVLEGHDKQFLLDRLSLFIRQESGKGRPQAQNDERAEN